MTQKNTSYLNKRQTEERLTQLPSGTPVSIPALHSGIVWRRIAWLLALCETQIIFSISVTGLCHTLSQHSFIKFIFTICLRLLSPFTSVLPGLLHFEKNGSKAEYCIQTVDTSWTNTV